MAIDALAAHWLRRSSNDIENKAIPAILDLCVNPDKVVKSMRWKLKASLETGGPPNTQRCEYRADRGTVTAAADAVVTTLSFGWPRQPLTSSQIDARASD